MTEDQAKIILSVDSKDQARYRAQATNTQIGQEENSGYTYLEVYGEDGADVPPEIVVAPRDKTVVRGTTLSELHCVANARPLHALEILWFKDGRPIDQVHLWSLYILKFIHFKAPKPHIIVLVLY